MKQYCESPFHYKRIRSKAVQVGDLSIGDLQPIRIQSMTTTNTDDIEATVNQTKALADAGCEIVRITAPNIKSAENLEQIVNQLRRDNYTVPIVADIHFTPNAALKAAEFVEKVRVNPGNYADKKKFAVIEYTDQAYSDELAKIEEKFTPLVEKLKQYKRALRIGTNHGSLSDRIMNRYGDTALGMVESAWEFAEICIKNDFHNFVFSMKASNPEVMIQAYRLLQNRMLLENKIYPLHLGVTEAGDGQDGRIKSMVGICSLLEDGIGDTIRVSLTESPLKEVPVARYIADHYNHKQAEEIHIVRDERRNPFQFTKRESVQVQSIGNQQVAQVILDISHHNLNANLESALRSKQKADSLIVKAEQIDPVRQIDDRINLIVRVDGINRTGLKQVIVSDYDLIEDQLKSASLVIFELKMGLLTKDMIDELEKMK
ncbi:MAG: (E)-4-hydroxy-3-methylbut-2-enyl-diphosphate synthase, partial [Calditrichaeota bacterium]|nr:(E)-4-hydroxy-3-methylbut-2-enyl-diphosphate synthase [Calditrichota bacterium]